METNNQPTRLEAITALVENLLKDSAYFIYDIYIKPTNNIKVFLDGDEGITINAIAPINRTLRNQIEELNWYPEGDFSIEVSSPGIDEPIKFLRQYRKNVGRTLLVKSTDETKADIEGVLTSVNEEGTAITIEVADKKKKTQETFTINIDEIKFAQVQIVF